MRPRKPPIIMTQPTTSRSSQSTPGTGPRSPKVTIAPMQIRKMLAPIPTNLSESSGSSQQRQNATNQRLRKGLERDKSHRYLCPISVTRKAGPAIPYRREALRPAAGTRADHRERRDAGGGRTQHRRSQPDRHCAGHDEQIQLRWCDPALGTDHELDLPVGRQVHGSERLRGLLVQHVRRRRGLEQLTDGLGVHRLRDDRLPCPAGLLAASRAAERHRRSDFSPRSSFQRATDRAAAQGTTVSTPTSVIAWTASSPRSPLAMAWTTVSLTSGSGSPQRCSTATSRAPLATRVTSQRAMPPIPSPR